MNKIFLVFLSVFLLTNCASRTDIGGTLPQKSEQIALNVKNFEGDMLMQPIGAYRIEESDFFIFKQRKTTDTASILLGPIGVLASHSAQKSTNASSVEGHEQIFRAVDMKEITRQLMAMQYPQESQKFSSYGGKYKMDMWTYGTMQQKDDKTYITYVTEVSLFDGITDSKKEIWYNQYRHLSPYTSIEALTAGGEMSLRADAENALRHNLQSFFTDMQNPERISVRDKKDRLVIY